jgi:RPM1-interacting protein 4
LQPEKGTAVPKFGAWDENNPSSAEGFTHIFDKVREERQTGVERIPGPNEISYNNTRRQNPDDSAKVCYHSSTPALSKQCMFSCL